MMMNSNIIIYVRRLTELEALHKNTTGNVAAKQPDIVDNNFVDVIIDNVVDVINDIVNDVTNNNLSDVAVVSNRQETYAERRTMSTCNWFPILVSIFASMHMVITYMCL
jgi:hypothetical protein